MSRASPDLEQLELDIDLDIEDVEEPPVWKHLDELEPGASPIGARQRPDVDELLREIGPLPNPELHPPVLPRSEETELTRTQVPSVTLTVLGGVAFMVGMIATLVALDDDMMGIRAAATTPSAAKMVVERKRMVVLQLPPFYITAQVPRDLPAEADTAVGAATAAATAAGWRSRELTARDAPPTGGHPLSPVALEGATRTEIDAMITELAAAAEQEGAAPDRRTRFAPTPGH